MMALLVSEGGQTLVPVCAAGQEISEFRRDGRFQWIHLEKQNNNKKRNSHEERFNERSQRGVYSLIIGCFTPLYCHPGVFTEAEENASCNLKGVQQLLGKI